MDANRCNETPTASATATNSTTTARAAEPPTAARRHFKRPLNCEDSRDQFEELEEELEGDEEEAYPEEPELGRRVPGDRKSRRRQRRRLERAAGHEDDEEVDDGLEEDFEAEDDLEWAFVEQAPRAPPKVEDEMIFELQQVDQVEDCAGPVGAEQPAASQVVGAGRGALPGPKRAAAGQQIEGQKLSERLELAKRQLEAEELLAAQQSNSSEPKTNDDSARGASESREDSAAEVDEEEDEDEGEDEEEGEGEDKGEGEEEDEEGDLDRQRREQQQHGRRLIELRRQQELRFRMSNPVKVSRLVVRDGDHDDDNIAATAHSPSLLGAQVAAWLIIIFAGRPSSQLSSSPWRVERNWRCKLCSRFANVNNASGESVPP